MSIRIYDVVSNNADTFKQADIYVSDSETLLGTDTPITTEISGTTFSNKQYSIEQGGTRMSFDPSEFVQDELFSLLNADDSMSLEIKVLHNSVKIRKNPNEAATCILISNKDDAFEVTKQWRGWFYILSIKGWIKSGHMMVTKVIKPYDPEWGVDFDDGEIPIPVSEYDAASIINAILNSKYKLPSLSVSHSHKKVDGTIEETIVSVLLDQLIGSRDLVDTLNSKVGSMPKIPAIPDGAKTKLTLVNMYDANTNKNVLEWRLIEFEDIQHVPELDLVGAVEF